MITIKGKFSEDLKTCTITIGEGVDSHVYHNLPVKKRNLRDWEDPQPIYIVKIPCAAALGKNYMAAFGLDAIYNFNHPERQELVLTPMNDDDDEPNDGKMGIENTSVREASPPFHQLDLWGGT
jgi:hypothetical protein